MEVWLFSTQELVCEQLLTRDDLAAVDHGETNIPQPFKLFLLPLFKMRLQCVKHLQTKIRPIAPYLAIFGSLNPRILYPVSKAFEQIFYIPGPTVKPYHELKSIVEPYSNVCLMQRDHYILPREQVCVLGATCVDNQSHWARRGYPVPKNAVINYDQHWVQRELQLDRNMDTILLTYFKIPVQPNYTMYVYAEENDDVHIPALLVTEQHRCVYLRAPTIEEDDHICYSDLFLAV